VPALEVVLPAFAAEQLGPDLVTDHRHAAASAPLAPRRWASAHSVGTSTVLGWAWPHRHSPAHGRPRHSPGPPGRCPATAAATEPAPRQGRCRWPPDGPHDAHHRLVLACQQRGQRVQRAGQRQGHGRPPGRQSAAPAHSAPAPASAASGLRAGGGAATGVISAIGIVLSTGAVRPQPAPKPGPPPAGAM
jgi:hypothetical protein